MTAPRGEVVKVRLRQQVYTSQVLPHDDAVELRDRLREQLRDIGDGPGMVVFTDRRAHEVDIRARDVSAVELGVPGDDEPHQHGQRRHSSGGRISTGTGGTGAAGLGGGVPQIRGMAVRVGESPVDFLRRQAEQQQDESRIPVHAGRWSS